MIKSKEFIPFKLSILPLSAIATLTTITISLPTQAENLTHLNQVLGTKNCSQCDLSNAGLVLAKIFFLSSYL